MRELQHFEHRTSVEQGIATKHLSYSTQSKTVTVTQILRVLFLIKGKIFLTKLSRDSFLPISQVRIREKAWHTVVLSHFYWC